MTQNDIASVLAEAFETMEPRHAPDDLLTSVFSATRATRQRSGLIGRFNAALDSVAVAVQAWAVRPAVSFAVLLALLALILLSAAFAGGLLRDRPATGWRALDPADPGVEYTTVSDILETDESLLAVGTTVRHVDGQECNSGAEGRVWSSTNGDTWVSMADTSLVGATLDGIVASGGYLFAYGNDGACVLSQDGGRGLWRSIDGVSWEAMPKSEPFSLGNVPQFVTIGETLIAVGIYQSPSPPGGGDFGLPETRVWSSTDGSQWALLATMSDVLPASIAETDDVLVMLGYPVDGLGARLLYSTDLGRTWHDAQRPTGLPESLFSVVANDDTFVAAGDEVAIASSDGRTWVAATTDPAILEGVDGLWALPDGFLVTRGDRQDGLQGQECRPGGLQPAQPSGAPGEEPPAPTHVIDPTPMVIPTDTCVAVPGRGGTSLSADGLEWRRGTDLPMPASAGFVPDDFVIGSGRGALIFTGAGHGARLWYAPLSDFKP